MNGPNERESEKGEEGSARVWRRVVTLNCSQRSERITEEMMNEAGQGKMGLKECGKVQNGIWILDSEGMHREARPGGVHKNDARKQGDA